MDINLETKINNDENDINLIPIINNDKNDIIMYKQ